MHAIIRGAVAVIVCYGAGIIGTLFTAAISGWYQTLAKPIFNPPAWVFAPVWMILYGLMSIALIRVWSQARTSHAAKNWVWIFFLHLVFNTAWSILFFGLHSIVFALIDIFALLGFIVYLSIKAWKIDRIAYYLMLPYLAWVSFATVLTVSIWWLN
jgi:tryptophan-rich sensory protein